MPPERAFVVQFSQSTRLERGWFSGRVEHIMSGRHASFVNHRELTAFFRKVMNRQLCLSPKKVRRRSAGN